jgi:hypothetical protein
MFDISPDAEFDFEPVCNIDSQTPVTIYPLLSCPPLAQGMNVALMGSDDSGAPAELGRYTMLSPEPIENLARMRYAAVHAGAREIVVWQ